jgi:CheY-like chemotaxis protein
VDFDLRSAIEDTLELMAGNAHAKQLELAAHVHADVPQFVHGDPNRVRQVLNNLVANAIKFTTHGEVTVTVAREAAGDQRVVLRFAIRDTGIGIPSEVQKRLFQPFMQADTSTTRRYGGTGLGLAISRTLVEQMHGRIGVVSEEGKGSTFHFTVRLERAKEAAIEPPATPVAPANTRVLIVEDNTAHATILGQLVKSWGLRPTRAATADAAVQHVREAGGAAEPYALVLLDAELPTAPGIQLAQRLRSTFGDATPRLVLVTGIGQQFDDTQLSAAGAGAWVTKPVREGRLREAIATVLAGGTGAPPSARPTPSARAVAGAPAPAAPTGARILLVEDNVINQQVALQQLQRHGLTADVAPNGLEALAALRRTPYELLLMDCMMPHLDGYETTRRIREVERRRAALGIARPEVHIVALTANAGPEDRARCLAAGMNDFVTKPLRPADLQRVLEHWRAPVTAVPAG